MEEAVVLQEATASTEANIRLSMLPPQMTATTLRPRKRSPSAKRAASPAAPAPLGDDLLLLGEEEDRPLKVRFAAEKNFTHPLGDDGLGELARKLDGDAVGDGRLAERGLAPGQGIAHGRVAIRPRRRSTPPPA